MQDTDGYMFQDKYDTAKLWGGGWEQSFQQLELNQVDSYIEKERRKGKKEEIDPYLTTFATSVSGELEI